MYNNKRNIKDKFFNFFYNIKKICNEITYINNELMTYKKFQRLVYQKKKNIKKESNSWNKFLKFFKFFISLFNNSEIYFEH